MGAQRRTHHHVLGAAFLAVVFEAAGLSGCTQDSDHDDDSHSSTVSVGQELGLRLDPVCPPAPPLPRGLTSAEQANQIMADEQMPAWDAGDIGASALMADGRIIWVFGDTVRQDLDPPLVANSMLVTSGSCASQVRDADDGPVIPDITTNIVLWPMSLVAWYEPGRQQENLVVLCSRIRRGPSGGGFDFTYLGTSTAYFTVPDNGAPHLRTVNELTPDNPDPHQINWGAASFVDADWIYVYGTRTTGEAYVFGRELYAGRIPRSSPRVRGGWQVWDGSRWRGDPGRAAMILPAEGGVSQTLSVDDLGDGTYLAVSKRDGDLSDFVYSWEATTPVGPWTEHKGVPAPFETDGQLEYAPLAHPEVPLETGQLLVTVSRNTTDLQRLLEDPAVGVPRFAEIDLP